VGPEITGLLGTGPRAMPLRAAPGEKLGAAACAGATKHNAQPMLQTPIACPTGACQLGNARTRTNLRSRRPWHPSGALRASLGLIPPLLPGAHGDGMTTG
jgi:hypothetical protein